jgi:hypothetical protein
MPLRKVNFLEKSNWVGLFVDTLGGELNDTTIQYKARLLFLLICG